MSFSDNNRVPYTTTDMHPEDLANPEKIVDEPKYFNRDEYQREYGHYHEDEDNYLDDDIHNYVNTKSASKNDHDDHKSDRSDRSDRSEHYRNDSPAYEEKNTEIDPEDETKWTKEELRARKVDLITKLGEMAEAGVKISKNYSMADDYKTMKLEYDLHKNIRSKHDSLEWMSNVMVNIIWGIEMLNDKYDPFDIKFNGLWSSNVTQNRTKYQDTLGEIYEKYSSPGKSMSPELKLFLMLTGSASQIIFMKKYAQMASDTSNVEKELDDPAELAKLNQIKKRQNTLNEMNKKIEEDHKAAAQKIAKQHYINQQEREAEQIRRHAQNTTNNRRNLHLTTEGPPAVQNNIMNDVRTRMKELQELENMTKTDSEEKKRTIAARKVTASQQSDKSERSGKSNKSNKIDRSEVSEESPSIASSSSRLFKNPKLDKYKNVNSENKSNNSDDTPKKKRGRPPKKIA